MPQNKLLLRPVLQRLIAATCALQNKLLLQRVLLVMVPGIDRDLFEASRALLPNMHGLLGEPTTVTAKSPQVFPGRLLFCGSEAQLFRLQ